MVWFFFSDKKRLRALAAAERVLADRRHEYVDTSHLNFRFHNADPPAPPPFEKWEEQGEEDLQEAKRLARERREEQERGEAAARLRELYREAWNYLTEKERDRTLQAVAEASLGQGRRPSEEEKRQAIVDAGRAKYRRDQDRNERRRRRDAIRGLLPGQ